MSLVLLLYTGLASLGLAALTLLSYEWWTWRHQGKTISEIVRDWDRSNWRRKFIVFLALTIIALSIQFLAIHFDFPVG